MKHIFLTFILFMTSLVSAFAAPEFQNSVYFVWRASTGDVERILFHGYMLSTPQTVELKKGDKIIGAYESDDREATNVDYAVATQGVASGLWNACVQIVPTGLDVVISASNYILVESDCTCELYVTADAGLYTMHIDPVQRVANHIVGDLNGDGKLTIEDVTLLTSTLLGNRQVVEISGQIITPTITYPITPTSLGLNESSLELTVPSTYQLTATVLPAEAVDKEVTWTSSNRSIATVGRNTGFVTAIASGTATITATTSNGVSATCVVTVVEPTEKEYIYYHDDTLQVGDEANYKSFDKVEINTSTKEAIIENPHIVQYLFIPKKYTVDHFESLVGGQWYTFDGYDIVDNVLNGYWLVAFYNLQNNNLKINLQ